MTEWKTVVLSDLGKIVGGATPATSHEDYYNGDIPWLTPKDLAGYSGRYICKGERNITQAGLESCSTKIMPANTVLFSSRAPIGYVAIAKNAICTNQGFKSVVPNADVSPLFLYYLLKYYKDEIEAMGSGTTFKEVSGATMQNIKVRVPTSLTDQERIAEILDLFDSKIELNRHINDNLEQQIFALFQAEYQHPKENEIWKHGCIGDVVTLQRGYDLPKDKIVNGIYPVVGSTDTIAYHSNFTTEAPCIIMGRSGNIGKPRLYLQRCWAHNTTLFSKEYKSSNPYWVYAMLKFVDYRQFQGGSAVPTLNRNHVHAFPIDIPTKAKQDEFGEFALPLFEVIKNNDEENKNLRLICDSLLPKLMSGEIDVSIIST